MSELSETILGNEKENAKSMLEKLWKLKSTLNKSENHSQIEELIDHYQSKLDVLRKKEEYITKTSQKSKKLFEEKQEKEEQITSMTSQINDYSDQINKLTQKRRQLLVERDKLTSAEKELTNELDSNQELIVAGLYDIITAGKVTPSTSPTPRPAHSASHAQKQPSEQTRPYEESSDDTTSSSRHAEKDTSITNDTSDSAAHSSAIEMHTSQAEGEGVSAQALYQQKEAPDTPQIPKSIVKTTSDVVIGEYYYDPTVLKNNRHYVFNSAFFTDQIYASTTQLQSKFEESTYNHILHIIQDAYKRITKNAHIHFEISTNELINETTLKDAWYHIKKREYEAILYFCRRIRAKIDALGSNYMIMLKEQLQRYIDT